MENSGVVPQNVKYRIAMWLINSAPRHIPRELKTYVQTKTCMWMVIAELFIIAQSINDPNVYTCNPFDGLFIQP